MRIRAVWSGLEKETRESGFGSRKVKIGMAPMTGKMPLILRSVVPAIPKEPDERAYLEEDLTRIGCIGLLNKPWTVKEEKMVRELIVGASNQYEGTIRARPETWDVGRWREAYGFSVGGEDLYPRRINSYVGSFGMPQTQKTGSPSLIAKIPGLRGCWSFSFQSSTRKSRPE